MEDMLDEDSNPHLIDPGQMKKNLKRLKKS